MVTSIVRTASVAGAEHAASMETRSIPNTIKRFTSILFRPFAPGTLDVVVGSPVEGPEALVVAEIPGLATAEPARRRSAVHPFPADRAGGVSIRRVVVAAVVIIAHRSLLSLVS
jgi:hypothetical protein